MLKKIISLKLDNKMYKELRLAAYLSGKNASEIHRLAIKEYLKNINFEELYEKRLAEIKKP